MVRVTKVYTKTGDYGTTQLAAGKPIAKNSIRIATIGCIDELNAFLDWAHEAMTDEKLAAKALRIQNELFNLGAQLAVLPEDRHPDTPIIKTDDITLLEQEIDAMNIHLPPLKSFVLPGGGETAARLHIARTTCRRAEQNLVSLHTHEKLDGTEMPYLNRLSDWLLVAARYVTIKAGKPEHLWQPNH